MNGCEECKLTRGCMWCKNRNTCEGKDLLKLGPLCDEDFTKTCPSSSSFDGGSFAGGIFTVIGIVLVVGLAVLLYRYCKKRVVYTPV